MKVPVCKSMFSSTLDVSNRTIAHWLSDPSSNAGGTPSWPREAGVKGTKTRQAKTYCVNDCITGVTHKIGQSDANSLR